MGAPRGPEADDLTDIPMRVGVGAPLDQIGSKGVAMEVHHLGYFVAVATEPYPTVRSRGG